MIVSALVLTPKRTNSWLIGIEDASSGNGPRANKRTDSPGSQAISVTSPPGARSRASSTGLSIGVTAQIEPASSMTVNTGVRTPFGSCFTSPRGIFERNERN